MAKGDQAGEKFAFPWRFVRSLALICITVVVLVYLLQRRMQYLPDAAPVPAPQGEAYRGLETVELKTSEGVARHPERRSQRTALDRRQEVLRGDR